MLSHSHIAGAVSAFIKPRRNVRSLASSQHVESDVTAVKRSPLLPRSSSRVAVYYFCSHQRITSAFIAVQRRLFLSAFFTVRRSIVFRRSYSNAANSFGCPVMKMVLLPHSYLTGVPEVSLACRSTPCLVAYYYCSHRHASQLTVSAFIATSQRIAPVSSHVHSRSRLLLLSFHRRAKHHASPHSKPAATSSMPSFACFLAFLCVYLWCGCGKIIIIEWTRPLVLLYR